MSRTEFSKRIFGVVAAGLIGCLTAAENYQIVLALNKQDGVYRNQEPVVVSVDYRVNRKPADIPMQVEIFRSDRTRRVIQLPASQKQFSTELKDGAVRFVVSPLGPDGNPLQYDKNGKKVTVSASIGAIAEPEKFLPVFKEPVDFQQFWDAARAELAKIPVKATRKEINVPSQMQGKFKCWDVQVDCAGGMPVSGYLSMPVKAVPKSLPAVVSFQGAGVAGSWKGFAPGAIYMNINAHGIANGQPRAFYQNLYKTTYAAYWWRNADNRDQFYFRNMFLRVKRALDYVKTLPEYDGRTLIVQGGSQGGAQAFVAAALDPDVKLVCAMVPAMCDHGGILAGRQSGWPQLIRVNNGKTLNPAVAKTLPYYEMAFFAKRIKAEVFCSVGLIDVTCCPTSVYAAYNSIPGKKHMKVMPAGGHLFALEPPTFTKRKLEQTGQAPGKP